MCFKVCSVDSFRQLSCWRSRYWRRETYTTVSWATVWASSGIAPHLLVPLSFGVLETVWHAPQRLSWLCPCPWWWSKRRTRVAVGCEIFCLYHQIRAPSSTAKSTDCWIAVAIFVIPRNTRWALFCVYIELMTQSSRSRCKSPGRM